MCGIRDTSIALVAMILFAAVSASAQNYPAKPVRILTGGAGTFQDVVTDNLVSG